MTQQQLQFLMQQFSGGNRVASAAPASAGYNPFTDPNFEPPNLPSPTPGGQRMPHQGVDVPPSAFQGNYFPPNMPHAGIDVPSGVFPEMSPSIPGQVQIATENNPIFPDSFPPTFAPNFWGGELPPINTNDPTRNIPPNETMYPDGRYFLGDPNTAYNTQAGFNEDPMPGFPNDPFQVDFSSDAPDFSNLPPSGGDANFTFSPDFINQINPPTNEAMNPTDMGYFPSDQPGDFSQPPPRYGDYFGQNNFDVPFGGGDAANVPSIFPAEGGYLPGEYERFIYGDTGVADSGSAPGLDTDEAGGPVGPATFPLNTPVTGANGPLGSSYSGSPSGGGAPFVGGGEGAINPNTGGPVIDPRTGEPVAGSLLSESDAAKRFNMQQTVDPRYTWHDALHPGQAMVKIMSDGTRVLVDAAGKIISGSIQAGKDLWQNILNDPRNTDPQYLASIGYHEMGPEGSGFMLPAGVTGPSVGVADTGTYGAINGGSYFHGGASAGQQHGATSVAGAFYNLGGSGPINANALGARSGALSPLDRQYLMRMRKGLYTSPGDYSKNAENAPSPFGGASPMSGGSNWNAFHTGQVQLGDILRANPAYYQSVTQAMPKTGLGPGIPVPRGTRGTPPTLPT